MERYFDIYLNAGNSVPVVINANQYDASETWIFTLYTDDNQQYTPASGSIVGLKSDGHTIANAGTVNNAGQVVIAETVQMTASAGINVFELVLDGNHGTANFVVLVEPRPGDNVEPSDSDLSLMEQAIAAAGSIEAVSVLQQAVNNVSSRMEEFIADHAGLSNETVLWTGDLYRTWQSSATTPTGCKATLSQKVTDFDYIGVYTTMNTLGNDQTSDVHWYNADEFADKPTMITCGTTKAYSGTTDWVAIPYITLLMDSDEVTCTVFNAGLVSWNGQAESNATAQTSEGSNNYQGSVVKIVGVKNTQTDTEVTDARVGADSTRYSTLKARLDTEYSDLKSAISNRAKISSSSDLETVYLEQGGDGAIQQVAVPTASIIGNLADLETENKTSIVSAINEATKSGGGGVDRTTVDLLEAILRGAMYSSDQSSNITQLIDHLSASLPNNNKISSVGGILTISNLDKAPQSDGDMLIIV